MSAQLQVVRLKLFRINNKNNFVLKCCQFLANLCKTLELMEQYYVKWLLKYRNDRSVSWRLSCKVKVFWDGHKNPTIDDLFLSFELGYRGELWDTLQNCFKLIELEDRSCFFALRIWNLNFIFLLFQIKSALEEEDGSSKIMQIPPAVPATNVAATPAPEVSPPKKKRPGRPPKNKKKVRIKQNLYH